jgi:hypothetical protein
MVFVCLHEGAHRAAAEKSPLGGNSCMKQGQHEESTTNFMASYKDPSFQERTALAAKAREKALKALAERPALDPAIVAEREAARLAREAAAAEKSAARRAAIAQAKADKQAAAEAAAAASRKPVPTEAELKAARDARYAARKQRKR